MTPEEYYREYGQYNELITQFIENEILHGISYTVHNHDHHQNEANLDVAMDLMERIGYPVSRVIVEFPGVHRVRLYTSQGKSKIFRGWNWFAGKDKVNTKYRLVKTFVMRLNHMPL